MERMSRHVPDYLLLHVRRLEETQIIMDLRKSGNDQRADIIFKMVMQYMGDTIVDEGHRVNGRNHQIFADCITAVDQLETIINMEI